MSYLDKKNEISANIEVYMVCVVKLLFRVDTSCTVENEIKYIASSKNNLTFVCLHMQVQS